MIASRLGDNTYLLDTIGLGQPKTIAVYVLRGDKVCLVDCGYAASSGVVLDGLQEIGISPSDVDYLIPTHVHLDHGGGTGHLLAKMPRAMVIAQERGVPHLVDPSRLVQSAASVFGEQLVGLYGRPLPVDPARITAVSEEMHLDLGGLSLTILHSPGHAPHQVSVMVEEGKMLLSADAVGIVYPGIPAMIPTTPPPSLNPPQLEATTRMLEQLAAKAVLAPHYGVRSDVRDVLETTRVKTAAWIEKVRTMKRSEAMTLDSITDALVSEVMADSKLYGRDAFPAYGRISVRTSVMGILNYLDKNPG